MRDGAIVAMLAAGNTQAQVASEFGVSLRTVQAVVKAQRESPSMLDQAPMQVIEQYMRSMRRRVADFSAMAYHHADANPSVAVAAMKGAQQAEERLIETLAALGYLPDNLTLVRAEAELRSIALEMVDALGRVESGEIDVAEAMRIFNEAISRDEQRQLRGGS